MSDQQPLRFFIPLPWEFFDAWLVDRRVKRTHVLTALYIAARCFEARNTGGGIAPIELSTVARLCAVSPETIRRTLHDLREWGWVDFEAGDGGDPAWRVWLTGLSLEGTSPRPLHDLSTKAPPPVWRGLSTASHESGRANPLRERERTSTTSPQSDSAETPIRDETRPQEKKTENLPSKGRNENDVGKTTAAETDPAITDRLIALAKRERPDRPLPGDDGFLDFIAAAVHAGHIDTGEALEREQTHKLVRRAREARRA
jgi:hypothetical protein